MNIHVETLLEKHKSNIELYEFRNAIMRIAERGREFLPDEVHKAYVDSGGKVKNNKLWGGAFYGLHKQDYLKHAGYAECTRPQRHKSITRKWIWTGKPFGFKTEGQVMEHEAKKEQGDWVQPSLF